MRFTIDRIDHIVLNVTDVDITAAWYQRVLGMEREEFGPHGRTALKFGGQKINLRPSGTIRDTWPTGATHVGRRRRSVFHHRGAAGRGGRPSARLRGGHRARSGGTSRRSGADLSVYCRDPDGNLVEIASYQSA